MLTVDSSLAYAKIHSVPVRMSRVTILAPGTWLLHQMYRAVIIRILAVSDNRIV